MTEELAGRASLPRSEDAGSGESFPDSPQYRNDLWITQKVFDYGLEENLALWEHASAVLEGLYRMVEGWDRDKSTRNDALVVAISDCHDRVKEEVRRHKAERMMRLEWEARQPKGADLS